MSERDNNDHNQKDHKNLKSDLQYLRDSERAQDVRDYLNDQDKLLLVLLNIDRQSDQRENTRENTPNSEFENLRI